MGSVGVAPAVFGVPPKTLRRRNRTRFGDTTAAVEPVGGTPTGATGTVALPKSNFMDTTEGKRQRALRPCYFGLDQVMGACLLTLASIFPPKSSNSISIVPALKRSVGLFESASTLISIN